MAFLFLLWAICLTTVTHQSGGVRVALEPEPFYIYTYGSSVQLVSFDATRSATVGLQDQKPVAIGYDPRGGYLFIVDKSKMIITASNSTDTVVLVNNLYKPRGVAFDWINRTLYWTDQGDIRFCLLDFGASTFCRPTTLSVGSLSNPHAIAVDPQRGQVYWTESGSNPRISRLVRSPSGTAKAVLLARKLIRPTGITVEESTGHVYWVDLKIPAVGCIGCQPNQHVIVKLSSTRYEPYSVAVFGGKVFFFNRRRKTQQDTHRAFYSLPTTKWTRLPKDCMSGSCAAVVSPRPELLLGSAEVTVFDFVIINSTLLDSFTGNTTEPTTVISTTVISTTVISTTHVNLSRKPILRTTLPSHPVLYTTVPSSPFLNATFTSNSGRVTESTKVSPMSGTKNTRSQNPTVVVSKGHSEKPSGIQTEISPTESKNDSDFLLNIHPGLLAAAAVLITAIFLTVILVIIVWRKRRSKKGTINKFSSLDRSSPGNSLYEEPSSNVSKSKPRPTAQVSPFAGIIPSTGIYDSVPDDLNNSICTGGTTPSSQSQDLHKQRSYLAMIMKDPANLTNPNYETVIEIDHVNKNETNATILLAMVPKHHYANLYDPHAADYSEVASIGNENACKAVVSVLDSRGSLSDKSNTSKSATSNSTVTQSSQSGISHGNTSCYGTTFHLQEPQKPQCAQTI